MTDKKMTGREIFEEAMRQYDNSYCDEFPPIEADLQFNELYESDMLKLKRRINNPFLKCCNTIGRHIAGIIVVATIVFSCSMTISAVREPVVEFFTNIYEKFVEIFFDKDDIAKAPDTIEIVYTLGMIPDGYVMDQFIITDVLADMTWIHENGDRLVLSQDVLDGFLILDVEESNYDIIEWNGKRIAFVEKYGVKYFFWNFEEYAFSLTASSNISKEESLALIDSLKQYNQ